MCTIDFETSALKPCVVTVCFLVWQLHKVNSTQKSSEENSTSNTEQNKYVLLSIRMVNQQGHRAGPYISELLLVVANLTEKLQTQKYKNFHIFGNYPFLCLKFFSTLNVLSKKPGIYNALHTQITIIK